MGLNVGKEIAAVQRMTVGQLRERYAEVFGEETPARNKQWLVKRIIWRMQSLAEGSLSERVQARAAELANDADIRRRPPRETPAKTKTTSIKASSDRRLPIPGTLITREHKGELNEVRVLRDGFDCEGENYNSLSAVAKIKYKEEVHEGEHEAIIDRDIWQRVQSPLKNNRHSGGNMRRHIRVNASCRYHDLN